MGCSDGKTVEGGGKENNGYPVCRMTFPLNVVVHSLVALNDDKIVLGAKDDLQLYDTITKSITSISKEHKGRINSLIKLKNGHIASAGQDKLIKIWDIDKKQCLMTFSGHKSMIWCINEINGDKLISGASDKIAKIWDVKEKKFSFDLFTAKTEISTVLQIKNGKILIDSGDELMLFDFNSKKMEKKVEIKSGIWSIKELSDGMIILGLGNGNINLIDSDLNVKGVFTNGHKKAISFLIELANNKVVSGSDGSENEKDLILWNPKDTEFKYLISGHSKEISGLTHISGNKFASVSEDKTLIIWE